VWDALPLDSQSTHLSNIAFKLDKIASNLKYIIHIQNCLLGCTAVSTIILHGSISQKTILNIILAAVRTWNLTYIIHTLPLTKNYRTSRVTGCDSWAGDRVYWPIFSVIFLHPYRLMLGNHVATCGKLIITNQVSLYTILITFYSNTCRQIYFRHYTLFKVVKKYFCIVNC
jgi:hypothetical protein